MTKLKSYRDGGIGMTHWAEDFCFVPIYPEGSDIATWVRIGDLPRDKNPKTGKSYWDMWCAQKEILYEALRMEFERFVYRQIVFCWMRGEGKSLLACLVQLWKFFNWPRQQIMLGANSKDQVKFVHFDIMRDIIINSPDLLNLVGGKRNIQEKEIRLKDSKGTVRSLIRSISSFSGIVSNITGYTFSEIFDMKNPRFYVQLDGSIRNIPNALGVIDSTVSAKTHILYQLYTSFIQRLTRLVFFSYRHSPLGNIEDYWNPNMDEDQLNDYKIKFPFGEFDKYFLNLWSAGLEEVFTEEMIEETNIIGKNKVLLCHDEIKRDLKQVSKHRERMEDTKGKGFVKGSEVEQMKIDEINSRFMRIDQIYTLKDKFHRPQMATLEDLLNLSRLLDTDFSILTGLDFGDPYAVRGLARTILLLLAKGLPGSKTSPHLFATDKETAPKYVYLLLHLCKIENHSTDSVKEILEQAHSEFMGIDSLCSERYGAWDMEDWCEDRDIAFLPVAPTYERQRSAFKEVLEATSEGRFKAPIVGVNGSKNENILYEEMGEFNHDDDRKWFGSTEKFETRGIQDDVMFALGWGMYGGKHLTLNDFRPRQKMLNFGEFTPGSGLIGKYT